MREKSIKEDRVEVYEIGYLLVSSLPPEKVADVATDLKNTLTKKGADFLGEETPELRTLAYTMTKKIGPTNHRFDQGYFGWFKFELSVKEIEAVKKTFEEHPQVLRMLVINTVKENTYLGKKSPVASAVKSEEISPAEASGEPQPESAKESIPVATVSIEEMDKSIDAMVKEA